MERGSRLSSIQIQYSRVVVQHVSPVRKTFVVIVALKPRVCELICDSIEDSNVNEGRVVRFV